MISIFGLFYAFFFINVLFDVGAVTNVPETTFNNMHGKITDLDTVDASILAETKPNALGEPY